MGVRKMYAKLNRQYQNSRDLYNTDGAKSLLKTSEVISSLTLNYITLPYLGTAVAQ